MNEFLLHMREALQEELDATNTYDALIAKAPDKYKHILEEIKMDEVNHQGRLLNIILHIDPSELERFNAGLAQEE